MKKLEAPRMAEYTSIPRFLTVLRGSKYESGDLLAGRKIRLRAVDLVRVPSSPIRYHFRSHQFGIDATGKGSYVLSMIRGFPWCAIQLQVR